MGDILTPPGLYIVPATQINRNERDHQTVVPQTVFWSFECKSTNNTDLLEAKKAIYRHWSKRRGCDLPILNQSLASDPYQLSTRWKWSQKIFISCHSISIGLIRISFVWTGRDHSSKPQIQHFFQIFLEGKICGKISVKYSIFTTKVLKYIYIYVFLAVKTKKTMKIIVMTMLIDDVGKCLIWWMLDSWTN